MSQVLEHAKAALFEAREEENRLGILLVEAGEHVAEVKALVDRAYEVRRAWQQLVDALTDQEVAA